MSGFAFMVQKPAFALDTASVACKRSTRFVDTVARHDNPKWIRTIRKTNRPHCLWPSDPLGELPV